MIIAQSALAELQWIPCNVREKEYLTRPVWSGKDLLIIWFWVNEIFCPIDGANDKCVSFANDQRS